MTIKDSNYKFYTFNHNFRNPPKIVTKDGNLVLKAGEDGDIVFEPGQGKQVFIGGNVLVRIRPIVLLENIHTFSTEETFWRPPTPQPIWKF